MDDTGYCKSKQSMCKNNSNNNNYSNNKGTFGRFIIYVALLLQGLELCGLTSRVVLSVVETVVIQENTAVSAE